MNDWVSDFLFLYSTFPTLQWAGQKFLLAYKPGEKLLNEFLCMPAGSMPINLPHVKAITLPTLPSFTTLR